MRPRQFAVYILASLTRRLYVGVTSNLLQRVWQHRHGSGSRHTSRYAVTRLVWYELTPNVRAAIEREKQIKGWRREKKIELIEKTNAGWLDLTTDWLRGSAD